MRGMKLTWIEQDNEGGSRYWDLFDEDENLIASLIVISEPLYVIKLFIFSGTKFEGNNAPMQSFFAGTEREAKEKAIEIIKEILVNIKYEAEDIIEKCDYYFNNPVRLCTMIGQGKELTPEEYSEFIKKMTGHREYFNWAELYSSVDKDSKGEEDE